MASMSVREKFSLLFALVVGMISVSSWMFNTTRRNSNSPAPRTECGPLLAPEPLPENAIIVRSVYWDNRRSRENTDSVHVFLVEIAQSALEMRASAVKLATVSLLTSR